MTVIYENGTLHVLVMPPKSQTPRNKKDKAESNDGKCGTCSAPVTNQDNGASCELCDTWYHCKCQGISDAMYKAMNQYSSDLHWFCKNCRPGAEKLLASISIVKARTDKLDEEITKTKDELKSEINQVLAKLNEIKGDISEFGNRMERCEARAEENSKDLQGKIDARIMNIQSDLVDKEMPKWSEIVGKEVGTRLAVVSADMISVQSALQEQSKAMSRDRDELNEIYKRRQNIIIHGMREPAAEGKEAQESADSDQLQELLHELKCDNVSVNSLTRLGNRSNDPTAKPRPIKMVLASEEQKHKVLQMSKNLKTRNATGPDKIFMHQDLTPNQREKRHLLVQELRQRRESGETDLMIVNLKIVKRRAVQDQE